METVINFVFLGSKTTADGDWSHGITRLLLLGRKAMTNRQCIKKQRHHYADTGLYSQSYGFSSSHVQMWALDHKEGWMPKRWCFQIVVLEKILECPLDCKEVKSVNPKSESTLNIHWKDWCWSWGSNTLATWCKEPMHWKRPWCWEKLKAKGEKSDRGWDG